MADAAFRFAERPPDPKLLPWIRDYWNFTVTADAPPRHFVPPDGCTSLVINVTNGNAGPVIVSGPWLAPLTVPVTPGTRSAGIRLQPGAAFHVVGVRPAGLRDRAQLGDHWLGALGRELREAVATTSSLDQGALQLDRILLSQRDRWVSPDTLVAKAVAQLIATDGELAIPDLARRLAVSERTLRRRFGESAGLSPKQFARIRRLLAAARHVLTASPTTWSQRAAAAGYADQPHLSREFADLTGLTPTAFEERVRNTEHDGVKP